MFGRATIRLGIGPHSSIIFSERELTWTHVHVRYCCRPFVRLLVCLSVVSRSCTLLSRFNFSTMFVRHLVPWPSADIHWKFYGDRPRGTPLSGGLDARGVAKYSDFRPIEAVSRKQCKIGGKLVLITNSKAYMSFCWYQNRWPLMTLNGVMAHILRYFTEFGRFRGALRKSGWRYT